MVVLGERTHLDGDFFRVEAQNFIDHQRIGNTVGQMVERTQLVCHRMADAKECVGESHTGHGSGICHLLTGNGILRAVIVSSGQIFKDHL